MQAALTLVNKIDANVIRAMNTLAQRIKDRLDIHRDLSLSGLAKACGISPAAISKWHSGTSSGIQAKHVFKAARYLRCRPEWLADGTGLPEESTHKVEEPRGTYTVRTPWPFEHITLADWQSLSDRDKGMIEARVIAYIDNAKAVKKTAT
jgi:transcriptional regulator with XRE-family HTH domain